MNKNNLEKILIIPDTHVPYHDKTAWELFLKVGKSFSPQHVVIMGDFADFYDVSSHSKSPERRFKLSEEINKVKEELVNIKKLGAKNNVYIAGNHEDRLKRYLETNAPELNSLISIPNVLELDKLGFKYVPYKSHYTLGKMNFTHDTGTAGRYAHYKALDTFQHNVIIGHIHRIGYAVEGNANGDRHVTASFGWLGDKDSVDYMHRVKIARDWSLGFGVAYLDKTTNFVYTVPVPILNDQETNTYSCMVEGKLYTIKPVNKEK